MFANNRFSKIRTINSGSVRHVTGNDQDYMRKIPRAVVQISAVL